MPATLASKITNLFKRGRKPVEVSPTGAVQPKPKTRKEQREAAIVQLQQGYAEVVDTMHAMRRHMDQQSARSDRLLGLMEGLPDVLRSIPETNAKQTSVLQAIEGQMRTQVESTGQLSTALTDLAGATRHQQEALGELHQQMDLGRQQNESLRDSLGILSETMEHVTEASDSNVTAMNSITEEVRGNDKRFRDLFQRSQKHTTVMAAVSWALALGALAISGYVAVMVARVAESIPAQQAVAATPATAEAAPVAADPPAPTAEPAPVSVAEPVPADPMPVNSPAPPPVSPADSVDAIAEPIDVAGFGALPALDAMTIELAVPAVETNETSDDLAARAPIE